MILRKHHIIEIWILCLIWTRHRAVDGSGHTVLISTMQYRKLSEQNLKSSNLVFKSQLNLKSPVFSLLSAFYGPLDFSEAESGSYTNGAWFTIDPAFMNFVLLPLLHSQRISQNKEKGGVFREWTINFPRKSLPPTSTFHASLFNTDKHLLFAKKKQSPAGSLACGRHINWEVSSSNVSSTMPWTEGLDRIPQGKSEKRA